MQSLIHIWISVVIIVFFPQSLQELINVKMSKKATTGQILSQKQMLGKKLFFDKNLSTPVGQSCADCHSPEVGFGQPNSDYPVSQGVYKDHFGNRNDLPAAYASFSPEFHYDPNEGLYIGGQFWDGRAADLVEQAKGPFLNPLEMANPDERSVVEKVHNSEYASLFRNVFGESAFDDPTKAYNMIAEAIAAYEKTSELNQFSSKYDMYLAGEVSLTEQELRGLKLFENEDKGNCAACHPSQPVNDETPPLFTDFTYDNLGVPKNPENPFYYLPNDLNPNGVFFVDLGLGGVLNKSSEYGKFKVPSLRNIAKTAPYLHNGIFKNLRQVVVFYNTRDVGPWPPPEVRMNVNHDELGNLGLSEQEIDDIVVFMHTLTDGYNPSLGMFEGHGDIGDVRKPGYVKYDAAQKSYLIAGGGENMWFNSDAFHFLFKQASGDISLAADIRWIGTGGNPHRKACLLIRQNLEPDSPYADAVIHGDGLTSLQYRQVRGGPTREIQSNVTAPLRIRIEKEDDYVFMSVANENETLHSAGGSFKIKFSEPFYIGLGVCAHDNSVLEKAVFSNVEIKTGKQNSVGETILESTLETIAIDSKDRRVVYHTRDHIEAPNWSRDGKYFLFNRGGNIYKLPIEGGKPQLIDTGFATHCNNDHGISSDGTQLVISDQSQGDRKSLIYILPVDGGTPHRVTLHGPSYWHGWSPDDKTLAFVGERNGEYDIYTIPAQGGEERRLTTAQGLDDGPDYSPDGKYIYFNSIRTGTMHIWRMKSDGTNQQQITFDEYNDWFPHPSPDGRWIVFLSYEKEVDGHPANKDVMLRIIPTDGGKIQVLAKLFGGQGTINVPSWSPDSKNLAFVSYRLIKP